MARIDKSNPEAGTTRAPLAAAYTGAAAPVAVGLNSSGRVVLPTDSNCGIIGVVCLPEDKAAGDIVDVMRNGELVDFAGAAGTLYTANTSTGVISNAAASGTQKVIGHTVEATRLVVNVSMEAAA